MMIIKFERTAVNRVWILGMTSESSMIQMAAIGGTATLFKSFDGFQSEVIQKALKEKYNIITERVETQYGFYILTNFLTDEDEDFFIVKTSGSSIMI
jgi:hypothetical protein